MSSSSDSQQSTSDGNSFRIAVIATSWRHGNGPHSVSHAAVLLTRWFVDRPDDPAWGWEGPSTQLASVYIEQLHDDDMIHDYCREHGVRLADSIEDALTLGGSEIAVDGVMLIGEHGEYPSNELDQKLYPRKELFDAIVAVYERHGKTLPMFCDKHFSWNFDWAQQMVDTAGRMGFLLFGGSSVPHCQHTTPLPPLDEKPLEEVVAVFAGGREGYGYHSMELVQACVEARPGGEVGIKRVTTYEEESLAAAQQGGVWSAEGFDAVLREMEVKPEDVQVQAALVVEYADGLRATHIHCEKGLKGWGLAVRRQGESQWHAAGAIMGGAETFYAHFARLARLVEIGLVNGESPFPPERNLLTTGAIAAAMRARAHPGTPLDTPELAIRYTPQQHSGSAAADV